MCLSVDYVNDGFVNFLQDFDARQDFFTLSPLLEV